MKLFVWNSFENIPFYLFEAVVQSNGSTSHGQLACSSQSLRWDASRILPESLLAA